MAPSMPPLKLVIDAKPRTKKNSQQIIRVRGRAIIIPSSEYKKFEKAACKSIAMQWSGDPIVCPVNCQAIIYRERNVGDACNFYEAIADTLEKARVVANDKWIVSWDGSRLDKDAGRPRIEITLSEVLP